MNLVGLNEMPYRGFDGLRHELNLSLTKKMIGGCFEDYNARHYPFKTFDG
jgi:hypothetical protein